MNYFMLISGGDPTCGIIRRLSSLAIAMEISEEEVPITAIVGWTGWEEFVGESQSENGRVRSWTAQSAVVTSEHVS